MLFGESEYRILKNVFSINCQISELVRKGEALNKFLPSLLDFYIGVQ